MLIALHAAQVLAHYLMINQLATADCCQETALKGHHHRWLYIQPRGSWSACLLSTPLNLQYFWNPRFPLSFQLTVSSNDADIGHSGSVAVHRDRMLVSLKKVGSAINRSLISAQFSISAYFLTIQTYKHVDLTAWVTVSSNSLHVP